MQTHEKQMNYTGESSRSSTCTGHTLYIYIDIPSSYIQNMKQAHLQTKTMKMGG